MMQVGGFELTAGHVEFFGAVVLQVLAFGRYALRIERQLMGLGMRLYHVEKALGISGQSKETGEGSK